MNDQAEVQRDMCREIAAAVGLPPAGTYPSLVRRLQGHFAQTADGDGLRPVLILDEAHDLRPETLAMLRVLTNFDMDIHGDAEEIVPVDQARTLAATLREYVH